MRLARAAQGQQMFGGLESTYTRPFASVGEQPGMFGRWRNIETLLAQPRPLPRGLMEAFVNTCQRWRLSEHSQAVLLGYGTSPVLASEFLSGRFLNLPQDARDRAAYIVGISVGLGALFNEVVQAELGWLNRPHPALRDQSPLPFMLQGQMSNVITVSALVAEEQGLR
jgi:hypothetical protein